MNEVVESNIYRVLYGPLLVCCICKDIVTSIAPEDGRISPKHVELKEHK